MKLSIVIPNYNGRQLLESNFSKVISFVKNLKPGDAEIIIVDDCSRDDSISFLQQNYQKEIRLIKHTQNRGFSSAVNTGVRAANGEFIFLLNNDAYPKNNFFYNILDLFEDKKVFAISLNEENGFGPASAKFENGFVELVNRKPVKGIEKSFFVSGGSGIFRKSIWKELGGLDEKLFSPYYWEDLDICYRAMKRGYVNLWDPNSKVVHNHESTISKLNRNKVNLIRERNQILFIWKNISSSSYIKKHIGGVFSRISAHPGYLKVLVLAIVKVLAVLKLRRKEMKETTVSDEAIFAMFKS